MHQPDDHLESARAEVLARLWGAAAREQLPGIRHRHVVSDDLVVLSTCGTELRAPLDSSRPFARVREDFAIDAGGAGVVREPSHLVRILCGDGTRARRLSAEVTNSVDNLALARHHGTFSIRDSVDAEQAVVDGHPYHPCCRSRIGMSTTEVLAYAPEHRPVVELGLLAVPETRWHCSGTWPATLRSGSEVLVPIHPWQWEHVVPRHPDLVKTDQTISARPLMSLRTVAPLDRLRGYHLKTAVDVQLTSAVRTVSPALVDNGPRLSRFVAEVTAGLGHGADLVVQRDLAAGAVRVRGEPCRSLAVVLRESVDRLVGADELAVPIAAMGAVPSLAGPDPVQWLSRFVELVLPPLMGLLSVGIALEAHGQNTLVVLAGHEPVRVLYRDFGSVRISPRALARAGLPCPPLAGAIGHDDLDVLRTKVLAGLVWGVFGELVTGLSREHGLDPSALWRSVAVAARRVSAELGSVAKPLGLFADMVPVKATTMMRLSDRPTENQWAQLTNPLAERL